MELKNIEMVDFDYENLRANILSQYIDVLSQRSNIYIFGVKFLGEALFQNFKDAGYEIKGFVDNNKEVQGQVFCGLKIYSPDEIITEKENALIIIASVNYGDEIYKQLKDKGFKKIIPYPILTVLDEKKFTVIMQYEGILKDLVDNKIEYQKLYKILEDDKSKIILDKIIEFRKTFQLSLFKEIKTELKNQYFEKFILNKEEIFVDGGAYDGDTIINFMNFQHNYQKIYLFEPDKTSIDKARLNLKKYKNIMYFQNGLSDYKKTLRFKGRGDFGSFFCENGNIELECVALDEIVKEDRAFIKLDIEGFEYDALNGAKRLIGNGSSLAICVYHRPSDIWKIPKLILSINPKYKFYLRHYTDMIFETVLYGIVDDD